MPASQTLSIHTLEDMAGFAQSLAKALKPGDIITLDGPLGSGKTTLTQFICKAFGVSESVNSPSFGLVNEYTSGKVPLAHLDLYRLGPEKSSQIWPELEPYLDEGRHIVIIEWAQYAEIFPIDLSQEASVRIEIEYGNSAENEQTRFIKIQTSSLQLGTIS